jgi:hypothetical protein
MRKGLLASWLQALRLSSAAVPPSPWPGCSSCPAYGPAIRKAPVWQWRRWRSLSLSRLARCVRAKRAAHRRRAQSSVATRRRSSRRLRVADLPQQFAEPPAPHARALDAIGRAIFANATLACFAQPMCVAQPGVIGEAPEFRNGVQLLHLQSPSCGAACPSRDGRFALCFARAKSIKRQGSR